MDCKKTHTLLSDYIDQNLSDKDHVQIKSHLESCPECTTLYHNLIQSLSQLKPRSDISEQAFYYTRLKQRMENRKNENGFNWMAIFTRKLVQPIFYLATIIFAVYVGILIGSNSPNQNQYSETDSANETPLETFAEYNYINDLEIEPIENLIIEEDE